MNDYDARLALARKAWQATTPDAASVAAGAGRVRSALARGPRRADQRRLIALAVAALVAGGALAYAATGGRIWFAASDDGPSGAAHPESRPPEPPARPSPAGRGDAPLPPAATPPQDAPVGSPTPRHAQTPARAQSGSATSDAPATSGAGAERAAWAEVDEALGERNEQRAERVLGSLAESDQASTRAKAKLGLAQLAAGRGDCARVRSLATEVAAAPGATDTLIRRARRLAADCR